MAMEADLSNEALGIKPDADRCVKIVSLPMVGIVAGMALTVGLLLLVLPFSDKIAISLSVLS